MFQSKKLIKDAIEEVTGVEFSTNVQPEWLIDPKTKLHMKLLFYNDRCKIGIEYQSPKHYQFRGAIQGFQEMQQRDSDKMELCKQNGVLLIAIPYVSLNMDFKLYFRSIIDDYNCSSLSLISLRTIRALGVDISKIPKTFLDDF